MSNIRRHKDGDNPNVTLTLKLDPYPNPNHNPNPTYPNKPTGDTCRWTAGGIAPVI